MKKILVPTDFSTCADNAIGFAVEMAKIIPSEISIFYSFEIRDILYSNYVGVNKEFNQVQLAMAQEKLKKIQERIKAEEGLEVKVFVSEYELHRAIRSAIQDQGIDLVVMGTQGATGIRQVLIGSRTARVIEESSVPVIAIPASYAWKKPHQILFITHHFEKDPSIMDFLFEFSNLLSARVEIAVFIPEDGEPKVAPSQNDLKLEQYEHMLQKIYLDKNLKGTRLYGNNLEDALEAHLSKNEIDMVSVVPHKRGFWMRLFAPGFARTLSYHTHIPLLAIPGMEEY